MNDDATTPELELASAYLDGVASDSERARVEASPDLLSLVATFEAARNRLRSTAPPAAGSGMEAAVAAALAEFDVLQSTPAAALADTGDLTDAEVAAPGNVVPLRRHRWSRVVLSAAAALLIGGVAVAAIDSFGGSSDDQSGSAEPAVQKAADTGDAAGGAAPQTISAIEGAASPVPVLDDAADLQAYAVSPDTSADAVTAGGATETVAAAETTAAGAGTATTAAAAETTAGAESAPQSAVPAAAPTSRAVVLSFPFDCPLEPTQVVVQEISWQGTPAVVVRDTVSGVIQAVDGECNVLASTQP